MDCPLQEVRGIELLCSRRHSGRVLSWLVKTLLKYLITSECYCLLLTSEMIQGESITHFYSIIAARALWYFEVNRNNNVLNNVY